MKYSRLLLLSFFVFLFAGSYAQNLTDIWSVQGKSSDGVEYKGDLEIKPFKSGFYALNWRLKTSDGDSVFLIGTGYYYRKDSRFIVAYCPDASRYGLFSYDLNEYGGLEGTGSWTSAQGKGAELMGGRLGKKEIPGSYEIVGRRPSGDIDNGMSETYIGTLAITKNLERFQLEWNLKDKVPYNGFGYVVGNNLVGVWGIGKEYGVKTYTIDADYAIGEGEWTSPNLEFKAFPEIIRRK